MGNRNAGRILVIAAHPDDEVLGCGGAIARHRADGDEVRVAFLAEGVTARFDPSEFDRPDVVEASRRRNDNATKALGILGVLASSVFTAQRHSCRLDREPMIDLVKAIERHLSEFLPTRLYMHAANDPNVDHRLAHQAVLAAVRPIKRSMLIEVLAFEVLSSTEWNPTAPLVPSVFIDIEHQIDAKVAALAAYDDEMRNPPHPRSEQTLRALARYRGAQAGLTFAEAFQLVRRIES